MSYFFFLFCVSFFVCVLVSVCFYTLFERKFIGYIQLRKGPFKVSGVGFLQSIADAIKLVFKVNILPYSSNISLYVFGSFLSIFLFFFS